MENYIRVLGILSENYNCFQGTPDFMLLKRIFDAMLDEASKHLIVHNSLLYHRKQLLRATTN